MGPNSYRICTMCNSEMTPNIPDSCFECSKCGYKEEAELCELDPEIQAIYDNAVTTHDKGMEYILNKRKREKQEYIFEREAVRFKTKNIDMAVNFKGLIRSFRSFLKRQ